LDQVAGSNAKKSQKYHCLQSGHFENSQFTQTSIKNTSVTIFQKFKFSVFSSRPFALDLRKGVCSAIQNVK
jgi:hypothetical protein